MAHAYIPTLILDILLRLDAAQGKADLSYRIEQFFTDLIIGKHVERDVVNNLVQESEPLLQKTMSPHRIAAFRKVIYGSFDRATLVNTG
jgi:hypothetical protein